MTADAGGAFGRGIAMVVGLPFAALLTVMALTVVHFPVYAARAIAWPFELDYGEGIVWQQQRMMLAGHGYAPLLPYPAIVFHYPPLYHLASAAMAMLTGLGQLPAARLLSALCACLTVGIVAAIVPRLVSAASPWPPRIGALVAAGVVLGNKPVLIWAVVMRVDLMFVALSFAGLWLGIRALRQPLAVHAAAACFVAAVFTKQTALAAPVAVFAVLLVARPRVALAGIASGLALALAGLALATSATHGQFLQHIVGYNLNRFSPTAASETVRAARITGGYVLVAVGGLWLAWRQPGLRRSGSLFAGLRASPERAALAMASLHFLLATLMLGLIFKSGASINYFLEWMVLVGLFVGVAIAVLAEASRRGEGWSRVALVVPGAMAAQALVLLLTFQSDYDRRRPYRADMALIEQVVRAAPAPVISDDMVLLLNGGKPAVIEPAIFAELTARRVLDDRPVLDLVNRGRFAMFITEGSPGDKVFDSRYTPVMVTAMTSHYPQAVELAGHYELRLPAGPLPDWAAPLAPRIREQTEAD